MGVLLMCIYVLCLQKKGEITPFLNFDSHPNSFISGFIIMILDRVLPNKLQDLRIQQNMRLHPLPAYSIELDLQSRKILFFVEKASETFTKSSFGWHPAGNQSFMSQIVPKMCIRDSLMALSDNVLRKVA